MSINHHSINTMKLRIRSLENKETLQIEVPDPCSIQQLKFTICRTLASSSSSPSPPSLHLSLNRKTEIIVQSPNESLHSIGISGGDLIFYTFNPNAFSRETLPHKPSPQPQTHTNHLPIIQNSPQITPTVEKSPSLDSAEAQDIVMVDGSDEAVVKVPRNVLEIETVKRVLKEALGDDINDLKVLVFAVHAVILDSGFVRVDQVSGNAISCFNLIDEMSYSSMISLRYTLPEILNNGSSHAVNLKIQTLGNFVNVCGSLSGDVDSMVHKVYLDKFRFARPLELMLSNSESNATVDANVNTYANDDGAEVFELWKIVKDRLAWPLLIDLCDKAGLELPPCLMRLPVELKNLILEYLSGDDLAKVCCTCSELRYLASNDELWKKKFEEEFGEKMKGGNFYKDMFAQHWATKKKAEQPLTYPYLWRNGIMRYLPIRGPIPSFGRQPIWGGEFDMLPHIAAPPFPPFPPSNVFLPLSPTFIPPPPGRRGEF